MRHDLRPTDDSTSPLEAVLRYALAIGLALVLVLPSARGFSEALGWLPLWLLAMPAAALWALRGFPLPARMATAGVSRPRRRHLPQARRRHRGAPARAQDRAARTLPQAPASAKPA